MLRCAARISSGSACAIAFNAAVRSPLLIAASTTRTAPRIWVRRDLLIAVRRAILRVAFLAEVVLAISIILRAVTVQLADRAESAPAAQCCDRRWWFLKRVPENAIAGPTAQLAAPLKEQRRRDCARRHWRPYRGQVLQRQRFPAPPKGLKFGREPPISS